MQSAKWLAIVAAIIMLTSCSSFQPQSPLGRIRPLSSGEAKLTGIEMVTHVRENMPYDVILHFRSDGPVKVEKVCFEWLTRSPSLSSSSSNCLAGGGGLKPSGGFCSPGPRDARMTMESGQFCVGTSDIRFQSPERLIARLRPHNLHADYNTLQARVEYLNNGVPEQTNIVEAPIIVDKY
ncbi:MAG: hypothetical protein ACP5IL_11335 [Syntrophobacteraceae bacterium]